MSLSAPLSLSLGLEPALGTQQFWSAAVGLAGQHQQGGDGGGGGEMRDLEEGGRRLFWLSSFRREEGKAKGRWPRVICNAYSPVGPTQELIWRIIHLQPEREREREKEKKKTPESDEGEREEEGGEAIEKCLEEGLLKAGKGGRLACHECEKALKKASASSPAARPALVLDFRTISLLFYPARVGGEAARRRANEAREVVTASRARAADADDVDDDDDDAGFSRKRQRRRRRTCCPMPIF